MPTPAARRERRFMRAGFVIWATVASIGAVVFAFRADDAIQRVRRLEGDVCANRRNGREFLLGYFDRHGMTATDRAEAERLGFVVIDCPTPDDEGSPTTTTPGE